MQSGLKFQVNREKTRDSGSMARDLANQHWETIRDAIYKIQNKQASSLSYEELYRTAYNLVLHKHGEMLYNNVKTTTGELLKPIADEILQKADDEFIKSLNKLWADQKLCIIMIKDILLYMNKNYVPKVKLKPVEQMQTSQFKHHIVLHPQIKQRLVSQLIDEIRSDRNSKVIDKMQIRSAVHLLIEVGVQNKKIYEQEFEAHLLSETANYYCRESNQLITVSSSGQYLAYANQRLKQEYERVQSYLSPSSEKPLIQVFLDAYISDQNTSNLLDMEQSGLFSMIKNNRIQDLTLLFSLLQRRTHSFELMRKKLSDFILEEGGKLMSDDQLKIEDFVAQLIQLRETIFSIFTVAMNKDPQIDMTIKFAFEKICNSDEKTPKALVSYLDEIFKKEIKQLQEAEITEKLDQVVQIFRYLQDKDVFEGHYTNSLAKRLLESRIINEDAERILLLKLKEECGFGFTQRLEVMYKDIKMSEELTKDFQQSPIYNNQMQQIEMNIKVLTTGNWPNDQREQPAQIMSIPKELNSCMNTFAQFYQQRFNNVRQLHWKMSLGQADIRSKLNSPTKFEFQVSTYQMCLLLLFNQHAELSYHQICQQIQIPTIELQLHLIPLIKCKLLLKNPVQPVLNYDDKLSVNMDFKSSSVRNKISVMVSKNIKESDNSRVQTKVEDDRRYVIDASIMKVMKARRKIDNQNLMIETTKLLQSRFKPEPMQIKLRIDDLIERLFIERDEEDKRILKYIS